MLSFDLHGLLYACGKHELMHAHIHSRILFLFVKWLILRARSLVTEREQLSVLKAAVKISSCSGDTLIESSWAE